MSLIVPLLRMLPVGEVRNRNGKYSAWMNNDRAIEPVYADTPEDALAELAIELFKQRILTPGKDVSDED